MEMETATVESLSPLKFWSDFVSKRQPVFSDWRASEIWNLEYLRKKAVSVFLI